MAGPAYLQNRIVSSMRRDRHIRWLIAPALLLLAAGTLYPIIYSGYLSLQQWNWG